MFDAIKEQNLNGLNMLLSNRPTVPRSEDEGDFHDGRGSEIQY